MDNVKCVGIIPARIMSIRLPGKPLKSVAGVPLLQRVWEECTKIPLLQKVVIATDDHAIFDRSKAFGASVLMTGSYNQTGIDRMTEAFELLKRDVEQDQFDIVVNIPVSLPFVRGTLVKSLVDALVDEEDYQIATLVCPITDVEEFLDTHVVKTAFNQSRRALFFSRAPIPYMREGYGDRMSEKNPFGHRLIPLIAFRPSALPLFSSVTQDSLESAEDIELLRGISLGMPIKVVEVSREEASPLIEVNTSDDLEKAGLYVSNLQTGSQQN